MAEEKAMNVKNQKANEEKDIKEPTSKLILRIVICVIIIIVCSFLILWLISRSALYNNIGEMLSHMFGELGLMWERITG